MGERGYLHSFVSYLQEVTKSSQSISKKTPLVLPAEKGETILKYARAF